jgi:hypothetical protein
MAGTAAELTRLLNAVMAQIKKLNDDQAIALADGSAELRYIPKTLQKPFDKFSKLTDVQLDQITAGEADYRLVPKTLVKSFEKLNKLTEEQLLQLANNEAEFKFVPKNPPRTTKAKAAKLPPPTAEEVRQAMLSASDQDTARAFFDSHKLNLTELRDVARELGVPASGTAASIIDTIIKVLVAGRLTTSAVRF